MKTAKNLEKDYQQYLKCMQQDKINFRCDELETHSAEELEQLADFGYDDEESEELFKIILGCRKRKADEQFIYNQDNINGIVQIDQRLKACCEQLRSEIDDELPRLLKRAKEDAGFLTEIGGFININVGEPILENAYSYHENLLRFNVPLHKPNAQEHIKSLPLLNTETNYTHSISSNHMANYHIGFAFYQLYQRSLLCLQDIVEIVEISCEVRIRKRFGEKCIAGVVEG